MFFVDEIENQAECEGREEGRDEGEHLIFVKIWVL
jgi:hypothetical protein